MLKLKIISYCVNTDWQEKIFEELCSYFKSSDPVFAIEAVKVYFKIAF